ncbi:MAG: hypothetical protein R2568_08575 [Candidatus Scalindua sp.]|nr:hypothetical protein [Candidatus Scalindua sp.]MDV5166786.1 hypothetical protein [Candidatus Scalindua sp.]
MPLSTDNINKAYHDILSCLIGDGSGNGACGINIVEQFQPKDNSREAIPRNVNAAFLISLSGDGHSTYAAAVEYLDEIENDPLWTNLVTFYKEGLSFLLKEFQVFCSNNNNGIERVEVLMAKLAQQKNLSPCLNQFRRISGNYFILKQLISWITKNNRQIILEVSAK